MADKKKTIVQTLILSKSKFTKESATKWVKEHEYRADKVDETEESYRFRQKDPADFDKESFRTIEITDGVAAVVGHLKTSASHDRSRTFTVEQHKEDSEKHVIHVLKTGTYYCYRGDEVDEFAVTSDMIQTIVANYQNYHLLYPDNPLPVNVDHASNRVADVFDVWHDEDAENLFALVGNFVDEPTKKAFESGGFPWASIEECDSYLDPEIGVDQGPTFVGVAITNYPVVKGLMKSPVTGLSEQRSFVMAETVVTKLALTPDKMLTDMRGALMMDASGTWEEMINLCKKMKVDMEKGEGDKKMSEGEATKLSERISALEQSNATLLSENRRILAEREVDKWIGKKILPASKPSFIKMAERDLKDFQDTVATLPDLHMLEVNGHSESGPEILTDVEKVEKEVSKLANKMMKDSNYKMNYQDAVRSIFAEHPDLQRAYEGR